jgi:hypothetical protein
VIGTAEGQGKHLIIWDCEPSTTHDEEGRLRQQKNIMFGFQKDLVAYARAHCSLSGVWYNVDSSKSGEDKCLVHTLEWIQEMVSFGDLPFKGPINVYAFISFFHVSSQGSTTCWGRDECGGDFGLSSLLHHVSTRDKIILFQCFWYSFLHSSRECGQTDR